jgi:hypothetical protein
LGDLSIGDPARSLGKLHKISIYRPDIARAAAVLVAGLLPILASCTAPRDQGNDASAAISADITATRDLARLSSLSPGERVSEFPSEEYPWISDRGDTQ